MTEILTAQPFEAFVKKQARADAIVNVVLAGGINYALTRSLDAVPLVLPFGNSAPNLCGTLVGTAVLMSILLTPIVFAITVAQRKAGKIDPGLPSSARGAGQSWRLVGKHLLLTLLPAVAIGFVCGAVAPDVSFTPGVFSLLAAAIAGGTAWFMSQSTTRGTLHLG